MMGSRWARYMTWGNWARKLSSLCDLCVDFALRDDDFYELWKKSL